MFLEAQAIIQEVLLPTTRHVSPPNSMRFPAANSAYVIDPSSSLPAIDVSKFAAIRIYIDSLEGGTNAVRQVRITFDKQEFLYPWANYLQDRTVLTVPVSGRLFAVQVVGFATDGGVQLKVEGLYQSLPQRGNWSNGFQVPDPHPTVGGVSRWGRPDPVTGITNVDGANGTVDLAASAVHTFWLPSPNASRVAVEWSIRSAGASTNVHNMTISNPASNLGEQQVPIPITAAVESGSSADFYAPAFVKIDLAVSTQAVNYLILRLRAVL